MIPNSDAARSGPYGVPGGTERWEHSSYRPRRVLEAALVLALSVVAAPALWAILAGAGLMLIGSRLASGGKARQQLTWRGHHKV